MAKKSWGGAGAWAAESELAEAQLEQQPSKPSPFVDEAAFPSLGEAANTKTPKKKKQQPVPLSQLLSRGTSLSDAKGLTYEDMIVLPTGPRDRSGEEAPYGGLGGGFRDYGGFRGDREGGGRRSDREGGYGREGDYGKGGFSGDRDAPDEPSRADTADDWGATKKFVPSGGRYDDDRRGSRFGDFSSKADDDDHWGSSKKLTPAPAGERRPSKYDFSSRNEVDDVDNWGATKRSSAPSYDSFSRDKDFGIPRDRDAMDRDKWSRGAEGAGSQQRPRLVLQPRTRPVDSVPPPPSKEGSENQPTSGGEVTEKPRSKINPFGEAKPREVILEEKGLDWKQLDANLDQKSVDRTSEQYLKEEIKRLQDTIKIQEEESEGADNDGGDATSTVADLREQLAQLQEKLDSITVSNERSWSSLGKKENGKSSSDAWSKHSSDGQLVAPERKARW